MVKKIALITGGYSGESVISYLSAATIIKNIDADKWDCYLIDIHPEGWFYITPAGEKIFVDKNDFSITVNGEKIKFDAVLVGLHGTPGEDGKLQGYFDCLKIPYTSCDAATSALTFNKRYTVAVAAFSGVHVARSVHLFKHENAPAADILKSLSLPLFVKPNNGGSSIGMSKVSKAEDLQAALEKAFKEDEQVLAEEFISGSPLPLTDGTIGPDGALYFLTGGRRLDSDLYRITYDGKDDEKNEQNTSVALTEEAKLRRQIEEYHQPKQGAVNFAWPYLKHTDRFVRYAARIAIEHQPVAQWQDLVLKEKDPVTLTQAAVALARQGNASVKSSLLQAINAINYSQLSASQQVDLLRAYELVFTRMGMPDENMRSIIVASLDKFYPTKNNYVDRQLSKILIHLQAPDAVSKTMALLENAKDDTLDQKTFTESSDLIFRNPQYGLDIASMLSKIPPAQQTYYAVMLSDAKTGWTPELQDKYFKWFYNAFTEYKGGQSFVGFIDRARKLALKNVSKDKLAYFNTLSGDSLLEKSGRFLANKNITQPKGPGRNWTLEAALPVADSALLTKRNFEQGKMMFAASMCGSCHSMRGEGARIGPDLTQLGTRFSTKDMLEAIIEPNKTISDQYAATVLTLQNGKSVVGRVINQDADKYFVSQNPFAPETLREVPKKDVVNEKLSEVSIMMPGMINRLNAEELKDLVAYLMAGGNPDHPVYTGKK